MIRRIIVIDRGAFARRVFATCRAVGVETVAVFTEDEAQAAYLAEADFAVRLPDSIFEDTALPGSGAETVITAARRCGADTVYPGHGPLAGDPDVAAAVIDSGLTWVGSAPKALAILASKVDTRALVAGAGLPVLPSASATDEVTGFPVLVKPSAGHGGRGLRVVREADRLAEAIASTRREAALTFGDGTVLCERYLEPVRHVEVQVIADTAGTVVPLGERECSIQRHRQKVIYEAPAPGVDPGLRAELFAAAVTATRAVGYVGAATVEFLLSPSGAFHFLEITPRLGIEHPTTECVFGVDLVRLQLLVAEGGALPFTAPPPMRGHAIAVRLAAEDPAYDWRPAVGVIHRFDVPGVIHEFGPLVVPGLRLDAAVAAGSVIRSGQDPTLGTLTAWAPTRHEASRALATALTHARLHGITTSRDLLVRVLRHPAYLAGDLETGFLDQQPEVFVPLLSSLDAVRLSCLAAALAGASRRAEDAGMGSLPTGWRNVPSGPTVAAYRGPSGTLEVSYQFDRFGALIAWSVRGLDPEAASAHPQRAAAVDEPELPVPPPPRVVVVSATPGRVELEVACVRMLFTVHAAGSDPEVCYVDSSEGSVALVELPTAGMTWPGP